MAGDMIERLRLEVGKRVARVNRQAALLFEVNRIRLETGNLRGEIAQAEKEIEALAAQAARNAYGQWKEGEEWTEELKKSFQEAQALEKEIEERSREIEELEKISRELKELRAGEKEEEEKKAEKMEEGEEQKEERMDQEQECFICSSCKAVYGRPVNYCRLCGTPIGADRASG